MNLDSPQGTPKRKKVLAPRVQRNSVGLLHRETLDQFAERASRQASGQSWKKIGLKHHYGVNVPVFSLKTEKSSGIGEYLDLLPLIDWVSRVGYDVIQLLPINATNMDNSPFSPLSSFSLNPLLLSISQLPFLDRETDDMKALRQDLRKMNSAERINWNQIRQLKGSWLRQYYNLIKSEESLMAEYASFKERECYWLSDYGLFLALKEKFQWKGWKEWDIQLPEDSLARYGMCETLKGEHAEEINFHMFIQFMTFAQMSKVKQYAESKNVFIKGDVPFLVSMDSADVWRHRSLFNTWRTAGAPPDGPNPDGQNWGLPLYNWEAMGADDYKWWKERLRVASEFFHLFRVDHIVGFFRVWSCPEGGKASEGNFEPSDSNSWVPQGEHLMKMLIANCNNMLPIGEDLGTVPPEVRVCLQNLGICGTKVLRWERVWDQNGQPYIPIEDYNRDSMTTISTHDCETLDLWWRDQQEEARAYCNFKGWDYDPNELDSQKREEILAETLTSSSMFHINLLNEYMALVPWLVYEDPALERINLPGFLLDTNWSYRMKPTVGQIADSSTLADAMKRMRSLPEKQRRSGSTTFVSESSAI